jgi:hypothetical protein
LITHILNFEFPFLPLVNFSQKSGVNIWWADGVAVRKQPAWQKPLLDKGCCHA